MRLANYTRRDLAHLCVDQDQTVLEAMQVMSKAGLRLIPVVSHDDGAFVGVAADGDLRRFIAGGGRLEDPVGHAANRNPYQIGTDLPSSEVRSLMRQRGVEYLPLVKEGKLSALYVLWATSGPARLSAVIMAGGLGSRLAPLTNDCPKPLIPLAGKPILAHIIEGLRDQGVTQIVLSVNYLADLIVDHFGDGSDLGVSITYVHETERLGTGGALGLVDTSALSEPFLCLNGDILNDINVDELLEQHQSHNWDATMVVRDYTYTVPYGVVNVTDDESFDNAEEKPTVHYRINAGFYMLSKSVLTVVPRDVFYDLPTLFSDLREREMRGGTYLHPGRWIDIGSIAELDRARAIFEGPKA